MIRVLILFFVVFQFGTTAGAQSVEELQRALSAVGCYDGAIDGNRSLALRTATRCYQGSQAGWIKNGSLNQQQWAILQGDVDRGFTVGGESITSGYTPQLPDGKIIGRLVEETTARSSYAAYAKYIDHVGFWLDTDSTVTEVLPDSPASVAGLRPGDKFLARLSGSLTGHYRGFNREQLIKAAWSDITTASGSTVTYRISRGGEELILIFPGLAPGKRVASLSLTSAETSIFHELPQSLRFFFSYIYVGDFETADMYKRQVLDKLLHRTTGYDLTDALFQVNAVDELLEAARSNRGSGIIGYYILSKSNLIGTCGSEARFLRFERQRYEVLVDGFGAEIGQRRPIDPLVYEFSVPAVWAPIMKRLSPIREAAGWSNGFRNFVMAAGGCDSKILIRLDQQMLRHIAR